MKDQYGNLIPDDLVMLDWPEWADLTGEQWNAINKLNWYQVNCNERKGVWISCAEVQKIFDWFLPDWTISDVESSITNINLISPILHRWNEMDGFYHA